MANEFAKALKQKRDAELRLQNQTLKPVVIEKIDGSYYAPEPQDYTSQLAAGKNISILTSGNIKTITALMNIFAGSNIAVSAPDNTGAVTISGTIAGKGVNITDFAGKNGYLLSYDSSLDKFILTPKPVSLIQATETVLGGIKAKAKTTESSEVAIDTATGKLYAPSSDSQSLLIPDYMTSDADGLKVYDSPAKISLKATLGRISTGSVDTALIPEMTSNNTPSGVVASSSNSNFKYPWSVFNSNTSDNWAPDVVLNSWISYEFSSNLAVSKYLITFTSGWEAYDFIFQGWNGTTWIDLDTVVNATTSINKTIANETAYKKYRFLFTRVKTYLYLVRIQLYSQVNQYEYDLISNRYMLKKSGAVLPTASVDYRGQIFTVIGGTGVADLSYICLKNSSDVYAWQQI